MGNQKKSFEEAVTELEKIVEQLEEGELSLDQSIAFFQKGMQLSKECNQMLDEAEKKIRVLIEDSNGEVKEEVFQPDEVAGI